MILPMSIRKYMYGRPHTFENADFETKMIGGPRYKIFVLNMCLTLTMSLTLRSLVSRLIPQSLLKLSVFNSDLNWNGGFLNLPKPPSWIDPMGVEIGSYTH